MKNIILKTISLQHKIINGEIPDCEITSDFALKGEVYCYQIAIKASEDINDLTLAVRSDVSVVTYYEKNVIANNEYGWHGDDYVLKSKDHSYPELLENASGRFVKAGEVCVFLVSVDKTDKSGVHNVSIDFYGNGELLGNSDFNLNVINAYLPKEDGIITHWFHCDCIAELHKTEIFSDAFYKVFDGYIKAYVEMGNNCLLVPLITPPLDTEIGGERMTAQLVDVYFDGNDYSFDFSAVDRYVDAALKAGIEYFELSHLFTQWGAEHCPKIVAAVNGKKEKIFGWEDDSEGERYSKFLSRFLPAVYDYFSGKGLIEKTFFHLSDEPNEKHIEKYARLYSLVKKYIPDSVTMDALSEYDFYDKGIVDLPVVNENYTLKFKQNKIKHLTYFCCTECTNYDINRFLAMPAERTRMLGFAMYKNDSGGFLHWGYNFYHTGKSLAVIDPYNDNSAGGYFPSGDAFIVYPDAKNDSCRKTLRFYYMLCAFQDRRALKLAEKTAGKEVVLSILDKYGISSYNVYPHSGSAFDEMRKEIYSVLAENIKADKT